MNNFEDSSRHTAGTAGIIKTLRWVGGHTCVVTKRRYVSETPELEKESQRRNSPLFAYPRYNVDIANRNTVRLRKSKPSQKRKVSSSNPINPNEATINQASIKTKEPIGSNNFWLRGGHPGWQRDRLSFAVKMARGNKVQRI